MGENGNNGENGKNGKNGKNKKKIWALCFKNFYCKSF